jgi:hypothetical protein
MVGKVYFDSSSAVGRESTDKMLGKNQKIITNQVTSDRDVLVDLSVIQQPLAWQF